MTGFSLVELLVVIGVVAVLCALLFPVASRVRERSQAAACVSNLGQIGMAVIQYANDHRQSLPGPQGTLTQVKSNLVVQLQPYIQSSGKRRSVWDCPANRHLKEHNAKLPEPLLASYISHPPVFGYYAYGSTPSVAPMKTTTIVEMLRGNAYGEEPWLLEDIDVWNYPSASTIGGSYLPVHSNGRNVLFVSGAVQWRKSTKGQLP